MANAFTLFGTLNIDAKRFQAALRDADKNLKTTASSLDAFEKRLTTTGNLASHIAHQIDKLASSINRLKSSANGVKNLTITLQGIGGAATSAANSVTKVSSSVQKATVDTSKFQSILNGLESAFKLTSAAISGYAGRVGGADKMTATATRQIDKLYAALRAQRDILLKAQDAYTAGTMSARQFAATMSRVEAATTKLNSKIADANAKLADQIAREKKATGEKVKAKIAADYKREAVERERAATRAAAEEAKKAAAAHKAQAAAMRQAEQAAKAKMAALANLGSKMSSAAAATKGFGTDLTYLVSVPMAAFAAYAFKAASGLDAITNKLTASTGSIDQASNKFNHFMNLAKTSPGVFGRAGASLFAAFKPMGLSDTAIDEVIRAFGRLKTAEENFDFDQFRLNMQQMFGQKFEMQDMKQALTFFPRFSELLSKELGLMTTDLDSLQKALKSMQDKGILTFEKFALAIANSVNKDANFALLEETLGNRFLKMAEQIEVAIAPIGTAIADRLEPAIARLVDHITALSQKFQALPQSTQSAILALGGIAAIIGPLTVALASVAALVSFVVKTFAPLFAAIKKAGGIMAFLTVKGKALAGVLGGVFSVATAKAIAIIAALAAAAYIVYKAFEANFGNLRGVVMQVIGAIGKSFADAKQVLLDFWEANKDSFTGAIENIGIFLGFLNTTFGPMFQMIFQTSGAALLGLWDIVKGVFSSLWEIISSVVMLVVRLIDGDFKGAMLEVANIVIGVVNLIIRLVGGLVRTLMSPITAFINTLADLLPTKMGEAVRGVADSIDGFFDWVSDAIPLFNREGKSVGEAVPDGIKQGVEEKGPGAVGATQTFFHLMEIEVNKNGKVVVNAMNGQIQQLRKTMEDLAKNTALSPELRNQLTAEAKKLGDEVSQEINRSAVKISAAGDNLLKAIKALLQNPSISPTLRKTLEAEVKGIEAAMEAANETISGQAQRTFLPSDLQPAAGTFGINMGKNMSNGFLSSLSGSAARNGGFNLGNQAIIGLNWGTKKAFGEGRDFSNNFVLGMDANRALLRGQLLGQNAALGFSLGFQQRLANAPTPPPIITGATGGGGGGARAAGKAAAQDFFEGLNDGIKMLKASANASLAQFFDIKQLRSGLKGKAGQSVVDFVKPIVDEMAKLPESATYLDQFNQKFGELAKSASPQMRKSFEAITTFLKEAQKQKDAAKAIETTSDAVQLLKDKLKELEGVLKTPKTQTQEMMEFLEEFQKKHGELAPDLQFWIMYRAGLIDAAEASKNATEALKEQSDAYIEAVGGLMEFVNLNAQNLTNTQQLELFLIKAAMAGQVFSEELVKAARAAATAADSLETQKTALAGVKTKLSELGVNLRDTIAPQQKLKEVFADTAGLQLLATELGVTVTKLRELILESYNAQVAIGDLMKPTADGMGVTAMTEMDVFVHRVRSGMLQLKKEMPSFSAALGDAVVQFASGIGDVFVNAMQEWDGTFKGFFRSVLQGFAQLVQQILAELLKIQIMKSIFSLFPSLAPTGTGGSGGDGFGVMGGGAGGSGGYLLAAGGLVRGPGTGTSDSIPAMLSNGEYVIPANVVKQMGVGFFDQIRSGRMTGMPAPMPSAASVSNTSNVVSNQNTFNISVPAGAPAGASGSMIQREIISALQKSQRRNR